MGENRRTGWLSIPDMEDSHKIDTGIDFVKIERKGQKTGAAEYGIFGYRR